MSRDELRQPLRKRSLRERVWSKRPSAFAAVSVSLLALFVTGGIWLSRIPHPFAGEPIVVATIPPAEELKTASTSAPEESPEDVIDDNAALAEAPDDLPDPPPEPPAYMNEANIITARNRPMKAAPVGTVTEDTAQGPLPRVSAQGKKPSDVYAQVTPMAVTTSARPKISIILGGMGLNTRLTDKAIKELPGDISFGFAPYGENLQEQVNRARAKGHEIMLQVPMEPIGYPGNNPGPKTLLSDALPEENIESLQWHMSRFAGYTGVTNYMGGKLLGSEEALQPVMKEIKKRGLVYLEDATVNLTQTPKIVEQVKLPMRRANIVIDADATAPAIAQALKKLEREAEANGYAIGTGSGLEVTIDTLAEWAESLQDKGILLIPISATYKGRAG
jgi:polysaccharide deacetylase 2 family uncharacterized protein YibQ